VPIVVTASPDPGIGAVRLTVTGGVLPYVVTASPSGDRPDYAVRSTQAPIAGDPTGVAMIDGQIPLNTQTVYQATDATGAQASSAVVAIASTTAILSDGTDPQLAVPVTVVSQPPSEWVARSVWWDVLGVRAPFASYAPMRFRHGDLVLRVETRVHRYELLALVTTGNPMLLRSATPEAVDDTLMIIERMSDPLAVDDIRAGARHFALTYQAITGDLGPYSTDASRMWLTVLDEAATWADLEARYATWAAVLAGDGEAGLGPELITDGSFSAGNLNAWHYAIWSTATWSLVGGVAHAEASAAAQYAHMDNNAAHNLATGSGRRYRITFRARAVGGVGVLMFEVLTNTAPQQAEYFAAGTATAQTPIVAGPTWETYVVEVSIPAGDDRVSFYLAASSMADGSFIEWDDVSVRERL
jgi:hypothetical protein